MPAIRMANVPLLSKGQGPDCLVLYTHFSRYRVILLSPIMDYSADDLQSSLLGDTPGYGQI